jgi:hypothetical protein
MITMGPQTLLYPSVPILIIGTPQTLLYSPLPILIIGPAQTLLYPPTSSGEGIQQRLRSFYN